MSQEQLIAIDEENASLRSERTELHALLNDTAQELDRTKQQLSETAGALYFFILFVCGFATFGVL